MSRLKWATDRITSVGRYSIPSSKDLQNQSNQAAEIRRDSKSKLILKTILWPLFRLRADFLIDGFIESGIGKWIEELVTEETVFLEVGCGDMSLRRFLPENICYNAFDLSFSEFHLQRAMESKGSINIALASAVDIPLESNTVSLIVATEVFEYIPEIDRVMKEIHRVGMPGAKLICSIPNLYCYKYRKKGPQAGCVNSWTYNTFIKFVDSHDFKFLRGHMKGLWIPLPLWFTKTSYQLPVSSSNEFYNTNFFYIFEVVK